MRRPRCVHSLSRRSHCVKCAKGMAVRGFTQFGDPVTSHHKILNVGNESRCGHKNASIVQDEFPNWVQGYPMTKDTSKRIARLQRFLVLFSEAREIISDKSKKLIQACQDLQWNHDTSTPSSLRNKRSGRDGRSQSERRDCCRTCTKWTQFFTTRWPITRHLIKNVM